MKIRVISLSTLFHLSSQCKSNENKIDLDFKILLLYYILSQNDSLFFSNKESCHFYFSKTLCLYKVRGK